MDSQADAVIALITWLIGRWLSLTLALALLLHWQRFQNIWQRHEIHWGILLLLMQIITDLKFDWGILICTWLAASLIPLQLKRFRRRHYQQGLRQGLPHLLDLTVLALQAGHSLQQALQQIAKLHDNHGKPNVISRDLQQLLSYQQGGLPLEKALREWATRSGVVELHWVVEAWVMGHRSGGAIAQGLIELAERLTSERFVLAERRAQQLPLKLLAPLFLCIFPSTFLVLFVPMVLRLWSTF